MTEPFFSSITEPIRYAGPDSSDPLSFRWYDADRVVAGRTMADHLRFAACYWHSFAWDGSDIFGSGTLDRPWLSGKGDPITLAEHKQDAAFEFFAKLGVPFYCFHDVDMAPEGATFAESTANLDHMIERAQSLMAETGVELLWGTANLFTHPRYMGGAATNPDPEVFARAAAQVCNILEATHRLGGANYVLWGGREGYETLLNTDLGREGEQLARFLHLVVEHKHRIGFDGLLLLEPKPFEPTKHQYDHDTATVHAFLQRWDLLGELFVNIEVNHATLAGHDFQHEIAYAVDAGIFGSVDANAGDDRLGWDVDRFPVSVEQMALGMYEVLRGGGLGQRRAQFRRQAPASEHRPKRPLPRPHRWHGHHGPCAARCRLPPEFGRPRIVAHRALCRMGHRLRVRVAVGIAEPARLAQSRRHGHRPPAAVGPPGGTRERRRPSRPAGDLSVPLVLGVDSSTQSTKVELRRLDDGGLVASGRSGHPPTSPPCSEQDPRAWWEALGRALAEVGDHLSEVVALSVAGQQHGLVILDEHGEPLRPAKLWNDTESAPQAEAMVARLGPGAWANACGSVPVASFTVTKLAWVAEHEPHLLDRIAHVLLPHDYLTYRLTGRPVTDRGDASGTAWWSPVQGRYRPDLLEAAGLAPSLIDRMPTVLEPLEAVGEVTVSGLGLPPGVVVGPGSGDNMAGALGIGLAPGDVAVSIGTSGTAYAVSETPTADATGAVAGFADASGRYLPLIATLNATKVTDWMARMLGLDAPALAALALQAEPGSGGVVTVPYFDGERTPNRPDATGALHGLRTATERSQLARSVHEGVVCGLLDGVDALIAAGVPIDGLLLLIGGGARSMAFRTIMAQLADRPVVVPNADEAVAAGACVQAAAVFTGTDPVAVARAWGMGHGPTIDVEPADGAAIRAHYGSAAALGD